MTEAAGTEENVDPSEMKSNALELQHDPSWRSPADLRRATLQNAQVEITQVERMLRTVGFETKADAAAILKEQLCTTIELLQDPQRTGVEAMVQDIQIMSNIKDDLVGQIDSFMTRHEFEILAQAAAGAGDVKKSQATGAWKDWQHIQYTWTKMEQLMASTMHAARRNLQIEDSFSESMHGPFQLKDAKVTSQNPLPDDVVNHIVFAGSLSTAPLFLKPLRFYKDGRRIPEDSPACPNVVVICPEYEGEWPQYWQPLSIFGRVWLIHGKGIKKRRTGEGPSPLEKARIKQAQLVVIPSRSRRTTILSGDALVVQTVRNVQEMVAGLDWHFRLKQTPKFIIELNNRHNIRYTRNPVDRPRLFANGQVYETHMLDTLVAQMFHSDATVSVLEHAIGYWDGNGRFPSGMKESFSIDGKPERDLESCHIEQWCVPRRFVGAENDEYGRTFGEFLDWALTQQQCLPIALYRINQRFKSPTATKQHKENTLPYVYTCPRRQDLLHLGDRVFVLVRWDAKEWPEH